ncbi:copper transport outer membrane protein MctB [Halopolyspora algeriensis]|uniref:Copper transport outer membrane protein MctB n=1 Tax=Halopolyspora algeriensis TaxID=1500506 RepID=A0A368VYS2_9ACTN|nr:copper transporter [Halopolyspora algeriensis]RCW44724.1 copper transport outer membrane protein MctB [Halopolyspora algeriensis]TQM56081.1 copper transport outer membrane protein MctB [Halopolyspora algeriensis]
MISLRYHTVSIAAVFLALATGVLLGSTSVSEHLLSRLGNERDSLRNRVENLHAERNALRSKVENAHRFGTAIGPLVVQGQLDRHSVVLVTTPEVSAQDREAMAGMLGAAGADVTGTVRLTERFTDPERAGQLRDVLTRLLPAGVQLPVASAPGTLAGGFLGPVTLLDPRTGEARVSAAERAAAFGGLSEGGFVRVSEELRPAELAVVLTGDRAHGDNGTSPAAMIARFTAQMDRSGAGAVLAGWSGSAAGSGAVQAARSDSGISSAVSTVDNADVAAGRVATVLALREQLEDRTGHYGVGGNAQGPVPRPQG